MSKHPLKHWSWGVQTLGIQSKEFASSVNVRKHICVFVRPCLRMLVLFNYVQLIFYVILCLAYVKYQVPEQ